MSETTRPSGYHMKKVVRPCGFHRVRIKDLGVTFGSQVVLENVNLHVKCGELLAVVGQNGAGKSTLIRAILDEVPHTGSVEYRTAENGAVEKMKIGYVPQHVNIDKATPMNVYDLMASFKSNVPIFLKSKKMYARCMEALTVFEAQDLIDKPVGELSGGQLQRVLLSLAVMDDPDLLLLDEPVSGVDQNGLDLFYQNMIYLRDHFDIAIIIISHDLNYVRKYADRVILLDRTVLQEGDAEEVFASDAFQQVFGEGNATAKGFSMSTPADAEGTPKSYVKKMENKETEHEVYDASFKKSHCNAAEKGGK